MPVPGPGYSITMRMAAPPSATAAGELTTAVGQAGGVITAFEVVESTAGQLLVAAAEAIADVVSPNQLNASSFVPSVFDEKVAHAVSRAVVAVSHSRVHPGGGAKESAMQ